MSRGGTEEDGGGGEETEDGGGSEQDGGAGGGDGGPGGMLELPESGCGVRAPKVSNFFLLITCLLLTGFCSPNKACEWCAYRKKRCHWTEEGSRKRRAGMTEVIRSSEKVGGKRRMTNEEDGDDGRRTRRRTEQEREEKEWRARVE